METGPVVPLVLLQVQMDAAYTCIVYTIIMHTYTHANTSCGNIASWFHPLIYPQVEKHCDSPSLWQVPSGCVQGSGHKHFIIATPRDMKRGSNTMKSSCMIFSQSGTDERMNLFTLTHHHSHRQQQRCLQSS